MRVGDKVTVVIGRMLHTRWVALVRGEIFAVAGAGMCRLFDEEGIAWIHGQHLSGSIEGDALLAASALVEERTGVSDGTNGPTGVVGQAPPNARWKPHKRSHFPAPDSFPRGTR